MKTWIKPLAAIGLLAAGTAAQACTLAAWDVSSGLVTAATPSNDHSDGSIAGSRFSGLCSLTNSGAGFLQDNSPGPLAGQFENQMRARFYFFLPSSAGTETIFTAYADDPAANEVFSVDIDGATGAMTVVVDDGAQADLTGLTANLNQWNSFEVEWVANGTGGTGLGVWLNIDATLIPTPSAFAANPGADAGIGSVQLGNTTGTLAMLFDDYESRRTLRIGQLAHGDANGDGSCNSGDTIGIVNEFLGFGTPGTLTVGQPDCNLDGNINAGDTICVVNKFLVDFGACVN